MELDFLKHFSKRMHSVGRYALLVNNSKGKDTWKKFGIQSFEEQMNVLFTVLLFMMEQSLKEVPCTIDDIADFLGNISERFWDRHYNFEQVRQLAEFIVDKILCNDGKAMYFKGFHFEKKEYQEFPIQFVKNQIVYLDNGVRRTSYSLMEDGYNMVLATFEIENNLKISVHEMLFKLHLEKADYQSAVQDIKNVFDQLRMQYQKIEDAMNRIRKNALSYSVEEYAQLINENMDTLEETRFKFQMHRETVEKRVAEFEETQVKQDVLEEKDKESLSNLRTIDSYLQRSLEEQQRILGEHLDLKSLYDRELENYTNMTMIQRFSLDAEIYDRVLQDARLLSNMDQVLAPLFWNPPSKRYNLNLAFDSQKKLRKKQEEDDVLELDFDREEYEQMLEEQKKQTLKKYKGSLKLLLQLLHEKREIDLEYLCQLVFQEQGEVLIPNLEIFREIMIEFLSAEVIDLQVLKKESERYLFQGNYEFELKNMIWEICKEQNYQDISHIYAQRMKVNQQVVFAGVLNQDGQTCKLKCSNIRFWVD